MIPDSAIGRVLDVAKALGLRNLARAAGYAIVIVSLLGVREAVSTFQSDSSQLVLLATVILVLAFASVDVVAAWHERRRRFNPPKDR